jgi:hypothetical protein
MAIVTLVAITHVGSHAAWAGDGIPLAVTVGFTVERNAGNANGWFCDDPSLVEAMLETRGDTNVWIVKGVKSGFTQCRVGTDIARASYVFDVTVKGEAPRRPIAAPAVVPSKVVGPATAPAKPTTTPTKPTPTAKKPRAKRRPRKSRKN